MEQAPKRRRLWRYAGAALAAAGGLALALGPGAAWLVDTLGDDVRVWRLGRIRIDGVSGGWIGGLRAEHVTLADDTGVWLDAEGASLSWRPFDILFGAVRIDQGRIEQLTIMREPALSAPKPSRESRIDVHLGAIEVDRLLLNEDALGLAAEAQAALSLDWRDGALETLSLTFARLDAETDSARVHYDSAAPHTLEAHIEGAAGGLLARALGVSERSVFAEAQGDGDAHEGQARFAARIGEDDLITGATRWTGPRFALEASARLDVLPALDSLAQRLGASVEANVEGERGAAFSAHARTPFLALTLEGALDDDLALDGPARFSASTARLSDIAHESPFSLGHARLEGELRRARGTTAVQATLDADELDALGQSGRLSGPVRAALMRERFTLEADLQAPGENPALFARGRMRTTLAYDRTAHRFTLDNAGFESDAVAIDARGWATRGDGEFSGEWRVRRLQAFSPDLRGDASGRWRAFAENPGSDRVWTTTVDGAGRNIAGAPEIIPQLLGQAPRLDARLTYEDNGLTVSHARLNGAQLRAGASGRIVRGEAALSLEASARGPLSLGAASISGAADLTGRLTGRIARPALSARAQLSSFSAGGVAVERPTIDFTLAPDARGYAGHAEASGTSAGQPLAAQADVAASERGLSFTQLDLRWAELQARGQAAFAPAGPSADLSLAGRLDGLADGVSGRIDGHLELTPEALALDATLADARAGEFAVRSASVHALGPPERVAATFQMRGRLREAPLTFEGAANWDQSAEALSIEGRGALARSSLFTRAPIVLSFAGDALETQLSVALDNGVVSGQWRERGRALAGSATIENAPLEPLAAIWGERAEGRIDGRFELASSGGGLTGDADLTLMGARFAGRQRGVLDMRITGNLTPQRLTANIDAGSSDGLVARFAAEAPVVTSAAPLRIALQPDRRGQASWSVRGPAASLWSAARLPDQALEGRLDGEGALQFGAGQLSGDGHVELREGRFEDKRTGVILTGVDARIAIDQRGLTIERFAAAGPNGGRISASGGSADPRQGRINVNVSDLRVANRPDARAVASGDLTLAWQGLHSTLEGVLNISQAELDIAADPEAGVPSIEVIEINRPDGDDDALQPAAPRGRNGSTALDVRVRAPGRVFTRGRGLDAEWSLDLRLAGTARNPQVFGDARAVRGTLTLSGQPFDIEDARIAFDGDPLDAEIAMTAVRDRSDLTARIHLSGTARDPDISFSSEPALPEDEILPQVLFGRSVEDLSAFEAAQLAATLAALSGRASLDLVDAARAAAGLDRLNVRQDENGGFLVAGGIYLTRDVYLEVARTGLGRTQTQVEWTLRPRLVLITSFLANGDQRVALQWRREAD